jgi:hypothetical protein
MAIAVECPHCRKRMSAVDEAAGKKVACIGCKKPITVPAASAKVVMPAGARPAAPPVAMKPPPLPQAGPKFATPAPATPAPAVPAASYRAQAVPAFEGPAPEITTSRDGTTTFQTPDRKFQMRVDLLDVHPADRGPLLEAIRERVWKVLRISPAATAQAELCVTCSEFELGSQMARYWTSGIAGAARAALTLTGNVDGKPLDETFSATRRFGLFGGSSPAMASACLRSCSVKVLAAILQTAGVPETGFSRAWRWIGIAKWAATATLLVAYLAIGLATLPTPGNRVSVHQVNDRRLLLIMGAMLAAGGTYAVIAMGAMLFAPRRFLETDPRGVRAMVRVGMQNIAGMRIAAFVMAAVGIVFLGTSLLIYLNP